MENKEFLEICKHEIGVRFKVNNNNMVIDSDVLDIDNDKIIFQGGYIKLGINIDLKKKASPSNLSIDCNWCYSIKRCGELLGYIYKPKTRDLKVKAII